MKSVNLIIVFLIERKNMMNFASNYRTKTLFQEKNNGVVMKKNGLPGYPMGIDIGYGGVKLYAPNI